MKNLYVVGGQRKKGAIHKEEWHWFQKGLVIRLDPESGNSEVAVEYRTPPDACAADEDPSILFKAGTMQDGKLYVCTQTEVLVYSLPYFERLSYISLPCFNDLHHVCPTLEGNLLVANAGLDMVLEITPSGEVLREWGVLGDNPWERFSRDIDYRKVVTTKPHRSHPNYVLQFEKDIWVTLFEQKDTLCLTQPHRRIEIGIERPHDGIAYEQSVYYTTIDGHIVVANLRNDRIEEVIDLNELTDTANYHPTRPLGWCRGLKILDSEHVLVGFSRLRSTKWRENIRWAKRCLGGQAGTPPTRVALYDLKHRKLCWEQSLEEQGMDAIFSIHTIDK